MTEHEAFYKEMAKRPLVEVFVELLSLRQKTAVLNGDIHIPTSRCPGYVGHCNDETGNHWSPCLVCAGGINGHNKTGAFDELVEKRKLAEKSPNL